jgi:hypothetical protein
MMQDPTLKQKQVAMYGATAVHASFGDVELAQMTLRGAGACCQLLQLQGTTAHCTNQDNQFTRPEPPVMQIVLPDEHVQGSMKAILHCRAVQAQQAAMLCIEQHHAITIHYKCHQAAHPDGGSSPAPWPLRPASTILPCGALKPACTFTCSLTLQHTCSVHAAYMMQPRSCNMLCCLHLQSRSLPATLDTREAGAAAIFCALPHARSCLSW